MHKWILCGALLAVGCAPSLQGNDPREPNQAALPAGWTGANGTTSVAQQTWSEFFKSGHLRRLIDDALKNNQEMNLQMQEVILAQTEIAARQGEYLPRLSAGANVGLEGVGKHTSQGRSDEAHGLSKTLGNFSFGLAGSWEIDVWGKLRNATKAAKLRYAASVEARNFLATQLIAEIARSYFDLIALDQQIEVLERSIAIQSDALEIVKLQKQAARVTELAVQRFEAEVRKNQSRRYDLEQERVQAENRINFLVGRYPQPVARDAHELDNTLPTHVQTGLPADLLQNRPDVRRAELQLEAAKLDAKAAKAAFYPSLSLDASIGYRAFNVSHLLATPESLVYGLGAGLMAPLLNRSAITAQYRGANAVQMQAVLQYERTLLQAFTDVANQLAMLGNLQKSYELGAQQVDVLAQSIDTSNVLFQSARADYMEVLMTRRDSLEAQEKLIELRRRQWQALVGVYQALGGGWQSTEGNDTTKK